MMKILIPLVVLAAVVAGVWLVAQNPAAAEDRAAWEGPDYGPSFGEVWHDGKAELAGYTLKYPRYGELREGSAVAITVTEPFLPGPRVKADRASDKSYEVVKLNLVEDFQTGVYDYNLMASVFVATTPVHGLPAGSASKVSFSSQEWCGHVYQQALFGRTQNRGELVVDSETHSYFEGEADAKATVPMPEGAFAEDALMLWARGLAGPRLERGEEGGAVEVPVFRSLAVQRLQHVGPGFDTATLSVAAAPETVTVPAGEFACDVYVADVASTESGDRRWTFYIERDDPARRVVKVTRSDGLEMTLKGVERMPYWQLNGEGDEAGLEKIGMDAAGPDAIQLLRRSRGCKPVGWAVRGAAPWCGAVKFKGAADPADGLTSAAS